MKVLILTTDTNHHNFFIYKLLVHYPDISVIIESDIVKPKYPTFHNFETIRDDFENNLWKEIIENPLKKMCSSYLITSNINNLDIINNIKCSNFDVCLVFGTRKINNNLIAALPKNSFNLHGGNPQLYRGLDSHLWSIWHRDLNGLKVCLHRLDHKLDQGEIFHLEDLNIKSIEHLYQLRSINTQKCVDISLLLLNNLNKKLNFICTPQKSIGRYYSFMPDVLKDQCISRFKELN